MVVLISLFAFVTAFLLFFLVFQAVMPTDGDMRIKADDPTENRTDLEMELTKSFSERVISPYMQKAAALVMQFAPPSVKAAVETRLTMAGGFNGLTVDQFLVLCSGVALVLGLFAAVITFKTASLARLILILAVTFPVGFYIPFILLNSAITKRRKSMQRDLPDVLDLMTVSVEAGLGFDGALVKLSEKMKGALVEEFTRMLQEIRMGVPRREALYSLGNRCGVPDVSLFTSSLIQADQLGASIGTVLRVQSVTMREKRRQRCEENAMKAPIKMLFPLVIFIFPVIFLVLLGPAAIQISDALMKK